MPKNPLADWEAFRHRTLFRFCHVLGIDCHVFGHFGTEGRRSQLGPNGSLLYRPSLSWSKPVEMTGSLFVLIGLAFSAEHRCGQMHHASTLAELEEILQSLNTSQIFFDLDETLLMPETPFIYGMPESDAFLARLEPCEQAALQDLRPRMEAAYYASPLRLVDPGLPRLIASLRADGKAVHGLTSRATGPVEYEWHNFVALDFLSAANIRFSDFPRGAGNNTSIGGLKFVGGENQNKGSFIASLARESSGAAVLVDNTLSKIEHAAQAACLQGVHFTAAHQIEQSASSRRDWICTQLAELGTRCPACQANEEI